MTGNITSQNRSHFLVVLLLTVLRGPLAVSFAVLFLVVGPGWTRVVAGLVLLAAMELTDLLDGFAARRFGVVTEWGAALDPYMDSFSRLIVYWTLACVGLIMPLVPLVMALRDVTVAYCRVFLARAGHSVAANWSGKIKSPYTAPCSAHGRHRWAPGSSSSLRSPRPHNTSSKPRSSHSNRLLPDSRIGTIQPGNHAGRSPGHRQCFPFLSCWKPPEWR